MHDSVVAENARVHLSEWCCSGELLKKLLVASSDSPQHLRRGRDEVWLSDHGELLSGRGGAFRLGRGRKIGPEIPEQNRRRAHRERRRENPGKKLLRERRGRLLQRFPKRLRSSRRRACLSTLGRSKRARQRGGRSSSEAEKR